jgi:hypothetical protein
VIVRNYLEWGCHRCVPNGLAKYFRVLGRLCFDTFLRSTCLGWLCPTLCSYAWYLGVSTLHTIKITITLTSFIVVQFQPLQKISSRDAPFKTLMGILWYWTLLIWDLFEVGTPTRLPWGCPCQTPCSNARRSWCLLTDKRRIPLRSASVRAPHLFHHGIPKVLVNPRSKGITSVRSTTTH